uniref:C-type lectin domain-containing protein n=1 Tax=Pygocentrus nattereri TaxID=42514 RepID=A0AAR2KPC1_PYGNA
LTEQVLFGWWIILSTAVTLTWWWCVSVCCAGASGSDTAVLLEVLNTVSTHYPECQKCALCGEGWRLFGVKCYNFSTDKLNWTMSRDYCAEKGGHLVIITSQAEQDFVSSGVHDNYWIGLNDLETEGKWMWVNNQTLTETGVTFWYERHGQPNEPDNWTEEDPSGENCAKLDYSDKWFDASCRERKKFICEKFLSFRWNNSLSLSQH